METYLLIARSVTHAQRMARALESCGVRAGISRAPTGLTRSGCSYAIRIRAGQWNAARACLNEAELRPIGIFRRDKDGYREVIE